MDDIRRVSAGAPHVVPQSFWMILLRVFILSAVFSRCFCVYLYTVCHIRI